MTDRCKTCKGMEWVEVGLNKMIEDCPACQPERLAEELIESYHYCMSEAAKMLTRAQFLCPHNELDVDGSHAYCKLCQLHVGDPCNDCGTMKECFVYICKECGK